MGWNAGATSIQSIFHATIICRFASWLQLKNSFCMKKIKKAFAVTTLMLLLFAGCKKDESANNKWLNKTQELYKYNEAKITITEGIAGTLTLIEGNCEPVIDENSTCKEYPVKRKIRVYEYTLMSQTEHDAAVYSKVNTKLITTVECDNEGFYQLKIAPGNYSVFIEEKGKLYASGLDGQGGVNPVTVDPSSVAHINLRISYAVY